MHSLTFQFTLVLSLCAMLVFANMARTTALHWAASLTAGVTTAVALTQIGLPTPALFGSALAFATGSLLYRPPAHPGLASLYCGFLAGHLVILLYQNLIPLPESALFSLAVLLIISVVSRLPGLLTQPQISEEALTLILVCASALACVPLIMDGWESAAALNSPIGGTPRSENAYWPFYVSTLALVLGMGLSYWRRR